jgi:hypothetical protein
MKASGSVVSAEASYQVVSPKDSRQLSEFLAKEGQFLLPMLELITGVRGTPCIRRVFDGTLV